MNPFRYFLVAAMTTNLTLRRAYWVTGEKLASNFRWPFHRPNDEKGVSMQARKRVFHYIYLFIPGYPAAPDALSHGRGWIQ